MLDRVCERVMTDSICSGVTSSCCVASADARPVVTPPGCMITACIQRWSWDRSLIDGLLLLSRQPVESIEQLLRHWPGLAGPDGAVIDLDHGNDLRGAAGEEALV